MSAERVTAVSTYLRERRRASGLTRAQLATRAQLSVSLVEKVELGVRNPTVPALKSLLDALNVPVLFRRHVIGLIMPDLLESAFGVSPVTPDLNDLTDLNSLTHPACFQQIPIYDVVAANRPFLMTFPGLVAGGNLVEWIFLDPRARLVLPEWETEARRFVLTLRMLSPGLVPDHRLRELTARCRTAPEWNDIWQSSTDPGGLPRTFLIVRDLQTGQESKLLSRLYSPESPARRWWLHRLVPAILAE